MAKTARTAAMAMAAAAILAAPRASAAADALVAAAAAVRHVRSSNPALVIVMQHASERSATFRGIVAAIDASDSIVFVEEGNCGHGVRACFVDLAAGGTNRYMRVIVDTRKADWDLMGSIGHELRHTLEVIGEPGVRDNHARYFFYERIAVHGASGACETQAAIDAGNTVRSEVRKSNQQAKSE
ncbi:MAG TPA: hypothetical protein VN654_31260 [Vicinamibacterales bacterium]|jgi:plastocyanin|nr:hypothetical protein [Vicinamibacterales bacterium]